MITKAEIHSLVGLLKKYSNACLLIASVFISASFHYEQLQYRCSLVGYFTLSTSQLDVAYQRYIRNRYIRNECLFHKQLTE